MYILLIEAINNLLLSNSFYLNEIMFEQEVHLIPYDDSHKNVIIDLFRC